MVFLSLQSLQNLCGIRIAYLMWTRHDLFKQRSKEELFEDFLNVVLTDIQSLPLQETMKPLILKHVKPAGKHLLSFLGMWFSKTEYQNSQKWLTEEMLFECLVLNANGLISYRKTAEKLLGSWMLHNIFAFRLACINFLEEEVLKLWPFVKKYYLNKIMLESERSRSSESVTPDTRVRLLTEPPYVEYYDAFGAFDRIPHTWSVRESDEVLFWISYCVSKENAIDIKELPHFRRKNADWHEYSLQSAAISGNVACFHYFHSFHNTELEYNHVKMFENFFASSGANRLLSCFVFHFMLLNYEEKYELFQKFPIEMVSYFLQWPLSLTFVEKPEELWNLIPDQYKKWIFVKIFAILFAENTMIQPFLHKFMEHRVLVFSNWRLVFTITGIHSVDHLENIWIALWKISLDSYKSLVFDDFVFPSIMNSRGNGEFLTNFLSSGLKEKLIHLFLTHGEAILELYAGANMEDSLKSLIAKYMPEGFGDGDRRYIPVRSEYIAQTVSSLPQEPRITPRFVLNQVVKSFLDYMKSFLFSSDTIDKSLFYY